MTEQTQEFGEILAQYIDGPDRLEAALAGLTEEDLDTAPDEENWSIRQIVHHIVDGDDLWKTCIKAALGHSPGMFTLQWYWDLPQDAWAEGWRYASRHPDLSLARFRANRRHILELVQGLGDAGERSIRVRWPNGQEEVVNVRWVVELQTRHALDHIEDIRAIRRARNLGNAVI
jgi:hypothetical protein